MKQAAVQTPVTVIGGFLGAGKTTFVNHLLRTGGQRYAVLVNDFGAINIDAGLIARHDGTTMTLTNGCVCCSIGDGFVETLCGLLDSGQRFDRILIEASGVGSPWRIGEIAMIDPELRLDGIIVLADATRIASLLVDARVGETVADQFHRATIVLLNKADLVDDDGLAIARRAVTSFAPEAGMIVTSHDDLPGLEACLWAEPDSGFAALEVLDETDHERDFQRWCYRRSGAFDRARLAKALAALPPQLLRLKGSCRLAGETTAYDFQMVDRRWELSAQDTSGSVAGDDIVLVGIGIEGLPSAAELDSIIDRALAPAGAA